MPASPPAPLIPSDLYRLALPSDPRIAADGRVFYVVSTQNEPDDETRTSIWCASRDEAPKEFTSGPHDRLPRVSPDGAFLAFVGDRGSGKRIFVMSTSGGEARAVTPSYDTIAGFAWSPDSAKLAFSATAPFDRAPAAIALDERTGARHIRALPFKSDDDGLLDGRRRHLFIIAREAGAAQQVTFGDYDASSPAWSPDGTRLAFTAKIDRPEASFSEDLFTIACAGGDLRKLTRSLGPSLVPAYAHDGARIAFLGHERGDDLGGFHTMQLFVVGADGGEPQSLTAALDRPVVDYISGDTRATGSQPPPVWSADDREIFVQVASDGSCGVVAISADDRAARAVVTGERDVFAFTLAADGSLAFAYSSPAVPAEIGLLQAGREYALTESNSWLRERAVRAPRRVRPPAADGTLLDLWLLEPDESNAPFVLQVHGGPHMAYGNTFVFEFQMLASHGIGVAYGNPRGSQTYGEAYATAIVGDWGGVDASDVLALLDGALANAAIDPARVALAGGSYGGFMTTWLLGHCTRFAAGISMRAVNDFVSEVGATDAGWFLENELEAPWVDGGRKLFERSPMRSAHAIDVPLLVEHSERDYRCAIDQGEGLFTLLRRLGRTNVEFVRFTGDGHGLSRTGKPRNRLLRLRAIAHWLIRHLRPAGASAIDDTAGALFEPLPTEPKDGIA
ncbi:MAG: S9 family peptidase [Candidatus Eremiobacteraeota bacterium]|nr:S9 family peptidase [Candidatus Eremiobacteraeota bacterium]